MKINEKKTKFMIFNFTKNYQVHWHNAGRRPGTRQGFFGKDQGGQDGQQGGLPRVLGAVKAHLTGLKYIPSHHNPAIALPEDHNTDRKFPFITNILDSLWTF